MVFMMTEEILNVKNLVGYYKGNFGIVHAVENVSLQVNTGEIIGIAGESGCGKSTFAELISGVPRPLLNFESGLVDIRGYDVYYIDNNILRSEVLTQIVGYVPQSSMNSLNPVLRVRDFVLDVMKQRMTKRVTSARRRSLSIKIIIECMKTSEEIPEIRRDLRKIISVLWEKGFIAIKAALEIKELVNRFKNDDKLNETKYYHLKSVINTLHQEFQTGKIEDILKLDQNASLIIDLLQLSLQHSSDFDLEKFLIRLFTKCLTKYAYRKIKEILKPVLFKIYNLNNPAVNIPKSWWDSFPQDITGIESKRKPTNEEVLERAEKHLEQLGLDPKVLNLYPHELSGGMKQRTVIGISTLFNPKLLIVDEPTSALDVTTQKKLLDLFLELRKRNIVESILFISHDIPTLRQICTRGVIMYAGQIVEDTDMDTIIERPLHPYTQALIGAIVSFNPDGSIETELQRISGRPPDLRNPPKGCRFHPRCPKSMPICKQAEPIIYYPDASNPEHRVKCWLFHERVDEFQKGDLAL